MHKPAEYMKSCERFADMVMLRALYLSWRSATRETPIQRAEGIMRFTNAPAVKVNT